ncbi:MAG: ThuA domain-containing protein [Isosphaeraceae bacterium]
MSRCAGWLVLMLVAIMPHAGSVRGDDAAPKGKVKILLIGKDRDHPPRSHEYMSECELLARCLRQSPGVEAVVSNGWPTDARDLDGVKAIVLYTANGGNYLSAPERRKQFEALRDQGVGLVAVHWSTGAEGAEPGPWWRDQLGGWFSIAFSKIPVRDSQVRQLDRSHPICRGWTDFAMNDEYYTHLRFHPDAKPLLAATIDGENHTIGWTIERTDAGKARAFGCVCGHFHECFKNESFRRAIVNAILWAARADVPTEGAPVRASDADLTLPPDPRETKK